MYSNPSSLYSTIGVVAFILVSEWFGGLSAGKLYLHTVHIITMCLVFCASLTKILMSIELRLHSVALTDTVQGAIMIFGVVSVTCVIQNIWGGWAALDPLTFPKPEFYTTPTKEEQWSWWQICLLEIPLVFYPVSIQRIYAASSLEGVRYGALAMWAAPWIVTLGTIFIGTMGVQIVAEACSTLPAEEIEACVNPVSPFSSILEQIMAL
jgi:Na+/proline symporter